MLMFDLKGKAAEQTLWCHGRVEDKSKPESTLEMNKTVQYIEMNEFKILTLQNTLKLKVNGT